MSVDTALAGSPEECRVAARRFRRLGAALSDACHLLVGQARIGDDDFQGAAATAYRRHTAELAWRAHDDGADSVALAEALEELATGLDKVGDVLRRVHAVAESRLAVAGPVILTPDGYADDEQRALYRRLAAVVASARAVEERLQDDYHRALSAATGTPPPPPREEPAPPGVAAPVPALPDGPLLRPRRPPPDDRVEPPPRDRGEPGPTVTGGAPAVLTSPDPAPARSAPGESTLTATYAPTLVAVEQALVEIRGEHHGPR